METSKEPIREEKPSEEELVLPDRPNIKEEIEKLRHKLRGVVLDHNNPIYQQRLNSIANISIYADQKPFVIIQPRGAVDIKRK